LVMKKNTLKVFVGVLRPQKDHPRRFICNL